MSCSNCFNGCSEIVSDKCVKYTGIDVPILGIQNGDSLSYVEQAIIEFLTSTLDGTGIKIDIDPLIICKIVKDNLPTCGDITAVDLFVALIKSVCSLQAQVTQNTIDITVLQNIITSLESNYTVGCLTTVTGVEGTHNVLQALITEFCAFVLDVQTNYVQIADLNTLIQSYLNGLPSANKAYAKMIPYVAMEYFGPLSGYPAPGDQLNTTGQGTGYWEKVYLCNGQPGTPDKRGVVTVGVNTNAVGGGPMSPKVDPAISGNPTYTLGGGIQGSNTVTLTVPQMPSHTHIATDSGSTISPNPHSHTASFTSGSGGASGSSGNIINGTQTTSATSLTVVANVTNSSTGGSQAHPNNQPAIACYYIMYIP